MSYSLSGSISSVSKFLHQEAAALSITYTGNPTLNYAKSFSTTDITKLFFATYTVGTSATSIDVTALTDAFGQALNFATVKHLQIVNLSGVQTLTVGGGTNGLFTALPTLAVNGCYQLTTNFTVDGTHKIIALTANASTASVEVLIVGV